MKWSRNWLAYALITTVFWGVWGALIEIPEKSGFPATLGFVVWALTMIPPALVVLARVGWKIERDKSAILLGSTIGFLGAGGQLVLFQALRMGPAYLVFPVISLAPVVTIGLSFWLLKERTGTRGWIGIIIAIVALPFLSYAPGSQNGGTNLIWIALALMVFFAWGIQAYVIKHANKTMSAEGIFFYMMLTAILLIPLALVMTDFSAAINWGADGPVLAAGIQVLNAIGALCLVYAFRYGKAIIVSPLTNAVAPVITVLLSLTIYAVVPNPITLIGIGGAVVAAFLFAIEDE
ncbi:MAG: DMT family transporter [Rhodothermia bacterium]|nr:MAG: DMT family transporter [Rhodothermia bacterium]